MLATKSIYKKEKREEETMRRLVFFLMICSLLVVPLMGATYEIVQDSEAPQGATLMDALRYIQQGALTADTLLLVSDGGLYGIDTFLIERATTIRIIAAPNLENKPILRPVQQVYGEYALLDISEQCDFELNGIIFDGRVMGEDAVYDSIRRFIRIKDAGINEDLDVDGDIKIINCDFRNVYKHPEWPLVEDGLKGAASEYEGKFIEWEKGSTSDSVIIKNCTFTNFGDEILNAGNSYKSYTSDDGVTYDKGLPPFSYLLVEDCTFNNVNGSAIKLCDDADKDTPSPKVIINHCTFYKCQRRVIWARDFDGMEVKNLIIANSIFGHESFSGTAYLMQIEGKGSYAAYIDTFNIAGIKDDGDGDASDDTVRFEGFVLLGAGTKRGIPLDSTDYIPTIDSATVYNYDPGFADPDNGDFTLDPNSPVLTLADDGGALGDRRWVPTGGNSIENDEVAISEKFELKQNYPNPFNPVTTIEFSAPVGEVVKLTVYNMLGETVEVLYSGKVKQRNNKISWDASVYPAGVYFCKLS
ncbi:MAG: hypothetical protein DRP88_08695, partial [Candidatus Neomarinimicrobiota bacterium]